MKFRLFSLLVCIFFQEIQCQDTDFAILEKIAAASSTCKYSRLSEVCKGKDCAALSGQCYCDDECHSKPEGCCIDVDVVENDQVPPGKKNGSEIKNCSMLSNRDDGGCNGSLDDCHVFFLEAAAVCFCHDECFEGNFNCCKDIYLPEKSCSAISTTKDERGFCDGEPKYCVVQPGKEFCYCDVNCVTDKNRKCCEDLDFPKNCSMIATSNKDLYGFCMGGPNNCIAKPDREEYCFCDVECVNSDTRKCCKDVGCNHGGAQDHQKKKILQDTARELLEITTFIEEKYDMLRRYLRLLASA